MLRQTMMLKETKNILDYPKMKVSQMKLFPNKILRILGQQSLMDSMITRQILVVWMKL